MSNRVAVFNYNNWPVKELFKGEEVEILANDYWRDKTGNIKVMDIFEANDYRGQYKPVPFDGSGKMIDDPKYHKKIRLEPWGEQHKAEEKQVYRCMMKECSKTAVFSTEEELTNHIKGKHPGADTLVLPEVEADISAKRSKH
jgi:hypothetical protein